MAKSLVVMEGIEKRFPGVRALHDARFQLEAGEVHALVGENGAGKSTLMKILTGVYRADAGRVLLKGREVTIESPRQAQGLGIGIIHQELNLMPHLTAAQNVFVGREPRKGIRLFIDDGEMVRRTADLFGRLRLDLDPRARVADLTVAKQQMVEIAKALSYDSEALVMDEPTSALSDAEIDELFRVIHQLREKGVGIIYISHRLQELKRIADRITVMRDGQYVGTVDAGTASMDSIISMMVGRHLDADARPTVSKGSGEVALEVRHLRRGRMVRDVSFTLRKGEVLGVAGLMGAGRTELARAIFGADSIESGEIVVNGARVHIRNPADAVRCGIGYLSEDRKQFGLHGGLDVQTNVAMAALERFVGSFGWVQTDRIQGEAQRRVEELQIKTPGVKQRVKYLSGGNQQKVVIAKWLARNCDILVFDEPTRGIDVAAKSEIHHLLRDLAASGKAIMMISSELPEILRLSDRILVMCEGRVTGELRREEATEEKIMQYATHREGSASTTETQVRVGTGVSEA